MQATSWTGPLVRSPDEIQRTGRARVLDCVVSDVARLAVKRPFVRGGCAAAGRGRAEWC